MVTKVRAVSMAVPEEREPPPADECKAEILRRVGMYKRAPTMAALCHRLGWFCCGEWPVEVYTLELVREGALRVTDGMFYLPRKWDIFSELG
jgi:hypothetical protein